MRSTPTRTPETRLTHRSNPVNLFRVLLAALGLMVAVARAAGASSALPLPEPSLARRFAPPAVQPRATQPAATIIAEAETTFFDVGLDNGDLEFDDAITAARKLSLIHI